MQTEILSQLPFVNTTLVTLREGPHEDLIELCGVKKFPDLECSNSDTALLDMARLLYKSLKAEQRQDRLDAAQKCIEFSAGSCSIAWLVLAREGAESWETAKLYAIKATNRMEQELKEQRFQHYCIYLETLSAAMEDRAQITWNAGERAEAISLAVAAVRKFEDPLQCDDQSSIRSLAASLLIQNGEGERALKLLADNPDGGEQWNYVNALAHFSTGGDTRISRSALTQALLEGTINAHRLIDGQITEPDLANKEKGETFENQRRYFQQTLPAWQSVAGSIDWLKECYTNPLSLPFLQSKQVASINGDLQRWQRWETLAVTGKHFRKAGNFTKAKNAYIAALHTAERIDYSHYPFELTIKGLIKSQRSLGKSCHDLVDKLNTRIRQIEKDKQPHPALQALHLASFARIFARLNDTVKAVEYGDQALAIFAASTKVEHSTFSHIEESQIRLELAEQLFSLKRYEEAINILAPMQKHFRAIFGGLHFYDSEMLEIKYESCLAMGDKEQALKIKNLVRYLNPFWRGSDDPAPEPISGLLERLLSADFNSRHQLEKKY